MPKQICMKYNLHKIKDRFNFGPGYDRSKKDFRIVSSSKKIENNYDFLIFTDSKGSTLDDENYDCWTDLLFHFLFSFNYKVLFISRPKEMTTFITLINFLELNKIEYKYLITNVGYAEHTPSKLFFINDIKKQISNTIYDLNLLPFKKEKYTLSNGKSEFLYSYNFGDIERDISSYLSKKFKSCILLGTMLFSKKISISRKRPDSFFEQLSVSNHFIKKIASLSSNINFYTPIYRQTINMKEIAHDGVHFSIYGHKLFYSKLAEHIKLNGFKYFK